MKSSMLPPAKLAQLRQAYASYFESFPWKFWATFTFERAQSAPAARARLESYLRLLEERFRYLLACVIVTEHTAHSGCGKPGGLLHYHVMISCGQSISEHAITDAWAKPHFGGYPTQGAGAHVEAYDPTRGAAYYMTKSLRNDAFDYELRNLDAVSSHRPITSAGRRRQKRFQARGNAMYA